MEKRASNYSPEYVKPKSIARQYLEINAHKNIVMKSEFLYQEDLKSAININILDERIKFEKWILSKRQDGISQEESDKINTEEER